MSGSRVCMYILHVDSHLEILLLSLIPRPRGRETRPGYEANSYYKPFLLMSLKEYTSNTRISTNILEDSFIHGTICSISRKEGGLTDKPNLVYFHTY